MAVACVQQQSTPVSLSEREVAIMRLVTDGASNQEIGVELGLGEPRIKQHIADIFAKLGANDHTHAVALAIRSGLLGCRPSLRETFTRG
jgi:DNA-binding CsgD family transcriptional regulator